MTTAVHPNVIAGEAPTLSPFAPASPDDLDKQHELGQFLTPNPVAEFMASLFEIHRREVLTLSSTLSILKTAIRPKSPDLLRFFIFWMSGKRPDMQTIPKRQQRTVDFIGSAGGPKMDKVELRDSSRRLLPSEVLSRSVS